MPYGPLKPFEKGNFMLVKHLKMCYKEVLKAGYLILGSLSRSVQIAHGVLIEIKDRFHQQ